MLQWLSKVGGKRDNSQPTGIKDNTSECSSFNGSSPTTITSDNPECTSVTSDEELPVEHIAESISKIEDNKDLQSFGSALEYAKDVSLEGYCPKLNFRMNNEIETETGKATSITTHSESSDSSVSETILEGDIIEEKEFLSSAAAEEDTTRLASNKSEKEHSLPNSEENQGLDAGFSFQTNVKNESPEEMSPLSVHKVDGEIAECLNIGEGETHEKTLTNDNVGGVEFHEERTQNVPDAEESHITGDEDSLVSSESESSDSSSEESSEEVNISCEACSSTDHDVLKFECHKIDDNVEKTVKVDLPSVSRCEINGVKQDLNISKNSESVKPKVKDVLFLGTFEPEQNCQSLKLQMENFEPEQSHHNLTAVSNDSSTKFHELEVKRKIEDKNNYEGGESIKSVFGKDCENFHQDIKGKTLDSKQSFDSISGNSSLPSGDASSGIYTVPIKISSHWTSEDTCHKKEIKLENIVGKAKRRRPRKRNSKSLLSNPDFLESSANFMRNQSSMEMKKEIFRYNSCQNVYPCCCHSSCLYNQQGRICTIFKKKYIFAEIDNVPLLVSLNAGKSNRNEFSYCKLIWQGQTPLVLSRFEDGTQVMFDAMLMPGTHTYVSLVVWHTLKPDRISLLTEGSLLFLEETTGFRVQLVSLNENKMGFIKTTIDGVEETILFSTDVVFVNGKKAKSNDEIMLLFQFPSSDVYVKVSIFLSVGSKDQYVYIPTCIWNGSRPNYMLNHHPCYQGKLYKKAENVVMPQELDNFSTLHCDIPCILSFTKSNEKFSANDTFSLKFILDNEIKSLTFASDKLYCGNHQVLLESSVNSLSIEVKAHIVKKISEESLEDVYEVMIVQISEKFVTSADGAQSQALAVSEDTLGHVHFGANCRSGDCPTSSSTSFLSLTQNQTQTVLDGTLTLGSTFNQCASNSCYSPYTSAFCDTRSLILPSPATASESNQRYCLPGLNSQSHSHQIDASYAVSSSVMSSHSHSPCRLIPEGKDKQDAAGLEVFASKTLPQDVELNSFNYTGGATSNYSSNIAHSETVDKSHYVQSSNTAINTKVPLSSSDGDYSTNHCSVGSEILPNKQSLLQIDIPQHYLDNDTNSSSRASSSYFSPVVGSPASDNSSYTTSSQISGSKPHSSRTSVSTESLSKAKSNPADRKVEKLNLISGYSSRPLQGWSFGCPIPMSTSINSVSPSVQSSLNSLADSVTKESSKIPSPSTKIEQSSNRSSFNQNLKQHFCHPKEALNVALSPSQNQITVQKVGASKVENNKPIKGTLYKTTCTIFKFAKKSGIVIAKGKILESSNVKARFIGQDMYLNGANLVGGDTQGFKSILNPYMNKEWHCLLELKKATKLCGVSVRFVVRLMWLGCIPKAPFAKLEKQHEINRIILKPSFKNSASAANSVEKVQVKATPPVSLPSMQNTLIKDKSPTPQPSKTVLRKGIILSLQGTTGRLRQIPGTLEELIFTRHMCYIYGVRLKEESLNDVVRCGLPVMFEENAGKVEKVFLDGCYSDSSKLDPQVCYQLLSSWCDQYSVPMKSRDSLLVSVGWLPPELNPTAPREEGKTTTVNLNT